MIADHPPVNAPIDTDVLERVDRTMEAERRRARAVTTDTWSNRLRAEALRRMEQVGGVDRRRAARELLDYLRTSPMSEERTLERLVLMLRLTEALGETPNLRAWTKEDGVR